MTRRVSLVRNVLSNWVVLATNVAYAFFITPIVVRTLDAELYGVWSFLNGLLAYSELLYLGLGSAVIKYVAQFRAGGDHDGINRLASVVASIYGVLGLVCLGVLTAMSSVVPLMFAEPLSSSAAHAASVTCVLLGARLLTVFIGSAFAGVVLGHDRFDAVNAVYLVSVLIRFAATPLVLARAANPLLALAWLTVAMGSVEVAMLAAVAFWQVPRLRVRPTIPRWTELRWLYGFGLQSFFILLAVKLISYTDTTVIGFTLGAASVALYVLPLQLVEYVRLTVGGFAGVFLPRISLLSAQEAAEELRRAYLRSARIACFLAGWLAALNIALGPAFLSLWIGPEFGAPVFWVVCYLSIATFAQVLSSQVPLAFYQGLHYLRFPAAVLLAEAVTNLGLSLWLAPRLGLSGVALATVLPALMSAAILPPYLCRKLGVPVSTLMTQGVWPGVLMLVVTVGTQWVLGIGVSAESFGVLIGRAALTVPLALGLMAMTFPPDDVRAIWRLLHIGRAGEAEPGVVTGTESDSLKTWLKRLAPDWLLSAAFRAGCRFDPSLARRSPLAMCHSLAGTVPARALPEGYAMRPISGTSAPVEWIETLRSAGIHVTSETWTTSFGSDPAAFVAAVVRDGAMVGTASLTCVGDRASGVGLVTWVGVRKEHQGLGLGGPLLTACLAEAGAIGFRAVLLLTDDHRLAAIKTYLGSGFQPCMNSWDWTHRPRWRRIRAALGVEAPECSDRAHADPLASIK